MTALSNINFTLNEKIVLNAMLPHQDSDFIPHGMSDIKIIQNWVAHTGYDMSLRSIKGIVGSLTKKKILFSEIMEEQNGQMIYFSYEYFDQQPENLELLQSMVSDEPAKIIKLEDRKTFVVPASEETVENKNVNFDKTDSLDYAKTIQKIHRKEQSCIRILTTRKRKIESVAKKYDNEKYQSLRNEIQTNHPQLWALYCEGLGLDVNYTLLDFLNKFTTK